MTSVVENNGRFTKDVKPLCQINALFRGRRRQLHQELKACHRNLAEGTSLDPVLGREPALALNSLLHSTAIARPRTIRIIETIYSSVFASLGSLLSSSGRGKRYEFELSPLGKESHKEIQHEMVETVTQ